MPKESRNFRLSTETLEAVRILSERWGVSQAQVIELLVREAQDKELRIMAKVGNG